MHISNHLAGLAMLAGHVAASSPPQVENRSAPQSSGSNTQFHATSGVTGDPYCDLLCQQFKDGQMVSSIGSTIESYIAAGGLNGGHSDGRYEIIRGSHISSGSQGSCGHEPSAIWKLWAQAHAHAFPNQLNNLGSDVGGSGKICVDASQLARLTAAATQCYSHLKAADGGSNASGGGSSHSWSSSSTWSTGYGTGSMGHTGSGGQQPLGGQGGGNSGDQIHRSDAGMGDGNHLENSNQGGNSGSSSASVDQGQQDGSIGSTGGGSSSISGGQTSSNTNLGGNSGSTSDGGIVNGGSGGSHSSITGNTGTTSSSTWGSGNVHNSAICFKIKDKRTDRYLTTYGSEYAFARLTGYYSIFRAYPAKGVDKGFTLTEVNRNGGAVNYPVKLMTGTGVFKPLYGDKDAVWTFDPVNFGDSCWGVPGKKMQSRSDWGGWGPNYRQASSGEDCVDVELEEADC